MDNENKKNNVDALDSLIQGAEEMLKGSKENHQNKSNIESKKIDIENKKRLRETSLAKNYIFFDLNLDTFDINMDDFEKLKSISFILSKYHSAINDKYFDKLLSIDTKGKWGLMVEGSYFSNVISKYFKNIKVSPNYSLKYECIFDSNDSNTTVFGYDQNKHIEIMKDDSQFILCNGLKESFLEYLVFHRMNHQFLESGHAYYGYKQFILNEDDLKSYAKESTLSENDKKLLESLDPRPQIDDSHEEHVFIDIIVFSEMQHHGIGREKYKIKKSFPHTIEQIEEEQIIDMNIGYYLL